MSHLPAIFCLLAYMVSIGIGVIILGEMAAYIYKKEKNKKR